MDHEDSSSSSSPKRKAGRKKFRETRHPVYRGVRERNNGKWVCEVREPNKKSRIWLGTYPTPEKAARAHDVAAIALKGESARLNFADSAWVLPRAKSTSREDIRRVASDAAQMSDQIICCKSKFGSATDTMLTKGGSNALRVMVEEEVEESSEFVDEEAMLDMPGLLREMAEGMMVTPPAVQQVGFGYWCNHQDNNGEDDDQESGHSGISLWSS